MPVSFCFCMPLLCFLSADAKYTEESRHQSPCVECPYSEAQLPQTLLLLQKVSQEACKQITSNSSFADIEQGKGDLTAYVRVRRWVLVSWPPSRILLQLLLLLLIIIIIIVIIKPVGRLGHPFGPRAAGLVAEGVPGGGRREMGNRKMGGAAKFDKASQSAYFRSDSSTHLEARLTILLIYQPFRNQGTF